MFLHLYPAPIQIESHLPTASTCLARYGNASLYLACQGRGRIQRRLWASVVRRSCANAAAQWGACASHVTGKCLAPGLLDPKAPSSLLSAAG